MARLRSHPRACLRRAPDRRRHAGRLRPLERRQRERQERAHFGLVALPSAPHESDRACHPGGGDCHRRQVRHPISRQAHLQSDQRRAGRDAAPDRSGLGVARAMGIGGVLCLPHGLRRRHRRQPRGPRGCDLRVHRVLLRADVRPVDLPGRAARDSVPPARKRRAAAVHLLHDFRSEDDAGLASRTRAVRRTGRLRRVVRAVPAVQDERAALVAGGVVARRAADRPAAAGLPLRLVVAADHRVSSQAGSLPSRASAQAASRPRCCVAHAEAARYIQMQDDQQ